MEWFMGPTGMFINQPVWIMDVHVSTCTYMYIQCVFRDLSCTCSL